MASFGAAASSLTAFILCWVALRLLMLPRAQRWFLDLPNHRSLHVNPIPRVGGIAMIPAALLSIALWAGYFEIVLVAIALMVLSLLDDWRDISASARLLGHLGCAFAAVWLLLPDMPVVYVIVLTVAVAWVTSLPGVFLNLRRANNKLADRQFATADNSSRVGFGPSP